MWQLDNRTPFAAGQSWIRNQEGAETWLVVVKATFDVLPDGSTVVAKSQQEVTRAPRYRGEPDRSSIVYENDFVLTKQTTDIVVDAVAYAPRGAAVDTLDVSMQVGPLKKRLRVFGDRTWGPAGAWLSAAKPFVRLPLTYERAFGGIDSKSAHPDKDWYWPNPVGTGFASSRSHISGTMAPNIEYPDQRITSWDSRPVPAGLGVIASHWQERAAFAGTYDRAWQDTRQPLLPADFDIRYFQAVPKDQQTPAFLRGGEAVELINLAPAGVLRFNLPIVDLQLETRFMDGERRPHEPPRLHTVYLEPERSRVTLVWHSAIECHAKVYELEQTRIKLRQHSSKEAAEVDSLLDLL